MSCTYLGKQIWSDIYGKKIHDYRFLFVFIYMFSFRLQEKIFMDKTLWWCDLSRFKHDVKLCCVVLVKDRPIMNFTTFQRCQYSASVNGWKKLFPWHGRQGVWKSGCFTLCVASIKHSRSILSTRLIKNKFRRNRRRYNLKRSQTRINAGLYIADLYTSLLTPVN